MPVSLVLIYNLFLVFNAGRCHSITRTVGAARDPVVHLLSGSIYSVAVSTVAL